MKMGRAVHDKKGEMNMAEMRSVEERLAELDQKMEQIKAQKKAILQKEKAQQKQAVDQHIIIWHFRRIKLCRNNAGIFHPRTPGILVITVIEKIITVITRLKMGYFNFPDSANYGIK